MNTRSMQIRWGCFAAILAASTCASGVTRYVDVTAVGGNTGTSWANAYTNLSSALAVAVAGDQIWVADGRYVAPAGAFILKSGVPVYGGFAGSETSLAQRNVSANLSLLTGDVLNDDGANFTNRADNRLRVISATSCNVSTRLDGFTISGGYGAANGNGIMISNSSFEVANCTFRDNYCAQPFGPNGGAAAAVSGGSMAFRDCRFTANMTEVEDAAGILADLFCNSLTVEGCTFDNNRAGFAANFGSSIANGVGIYSRTNTVLRNSTFSGNRAFGGGGGAGNGVGAYLNSFSHLVENCTFNDNVAETTGAGSGSGAGLWISGTTTIDIVGSTFTGNRATVGLNSGGGLFLLSSGVANVINSRFANNESLLRGGGLFTQGNATLIACEIEENRSDQGGGVATLGTTQLTGCLVRSNHATQAGGGIYSTSTTLGVVSCRLITNTSAQNGGGLYANLSAGNLVNSVISGNGAVTQGGGIYLTDLVNTRPWQVTHISASGNGGNGWYQNVTPVTGLNSIIRDGSTLVGGATAGFSYSNVLGYVGGTGNIDQTPQFLDVINHDLHLQLNSPCLDTGFDTGVLPSVDFDGDLRSLDGNLDEIARPDMGADELAPFVVLANSIETIMGEYFAGELGDIASSENQYYSAFCDPFTLGTTLEVRGTSPRSASRVQLRCELSADRAGLALTLTAYDFGAGIWRIAGGTVAPTSDSLVQFIAPIIGNYVGPAGACKSRLATIPINDEDPSVDGWLTNLDRWEWVMVP